LIDSINTVDKLIDRAFELNLKGVAITDHDALSGHVKAINYYNKKYKDEDFKLILGNEIYLTRRDLTSDNHVKGEKFYHLLLLAKDKIGHKQLREISSKAWGRAYYKNIMRVPTFITDLQKIIGRSPGHLVATTACLGGYTGHMFAMNDFDKITEFLSTMEGIFGKGNFFVELQPSNSEDQIAYNKHMIINHWKDYPFVFTTDSHYLKKEDREMHKKFLHSKSGDREVDAFYSAAYLMSYQEVVSYFNTYISMPKIEDMKNNTNKILNMIEDYDLNHSQVVPKVRYEQERFDQEKLRIVKDLFKENNLDKYKYLNLFINGHSAANRYLMDLVFEGYYDKIYSISSEITIEERMKRLDYELEQIYETSVKIDQSLSDYFITMAKMIEIIWNEADSLVGPGRGSAAGFLINYLIGITQLDPQTQMLYLPPWRFIHADRPGLPDIDVDTESTKRLKIFNKLQSYFNSIGADLINVCTFGTEGSKSALRTAGRSLELDDSFVGYLTSMVPSERGFDLTLTQCFYGDDEHKPVKQFLEEMNKNPDLWELAIAIEGLITRIGVHAAGVLITNEDPTLHSSIMKTSRGVVVSAYNLDDSEQIGGLKYDMLTVQALDKIHATMNYLLDDHSIQWQGTLRDTYNKYLLPANLNYTEPEMWKKLGDGDIVDIFQFDTAVGSQAIVKIKPQNIGELAVANSIMRLMSQGEMEQPLETYVKYKNNISLWYREMEMYGLSEEEMDSLEKYLKPLYGVADSQEAVMQLTMEPKITNFNLTEANSLRKAIAKKKADILAKTKTMFYDKGNELGTSLNLLNYVWNVQIGRQIGYSFSLLHTMAYSTIALQQMNLSYFYPDIYWKTACLSVNAGAINEEDYYNLVEEGIIELTDEDDVRTQTKIQYGKVASAISNFRGDINIKLPDINLSRLGFTPDVKENTIRYGIKGISRVGEHIIQEIILNRPYTSLVDFLDKLNNGKKKKVISKEKVVNLIKAGAFDKLEDKPRGEILINFMHMIADQKKNLTLSNFLMLIRKNLVPIEYEEEKKCYMFTKYIRKSRYDNSYVLDEVAQDYFFERFPKEKTKTLIQDEEEVIVISESWWDSVYNTFMNRIREWLKINKEELLKKLNNELYLEEYNKYAQGDILDWELQSINFFYSGHPLKDIEIPIEHTKLADVNDPEIVGFFQIKGKQIPEFRLYTIIGTVIDKNRQNGHVTLSTPDGVIDIKFYKSQFSKLVHEDEELAEENYFEKGNHLMITGMKRGDIFVPKAYKKTGIDAVLLMHLDEDRKFIGFRKKA